MPEPTLEELFSFDQKDFTFYLDSSTAERLLKHAPGAYTFPVQRRGQEWTYRIQDVTCFDGAYRSITCREVNRPSETDVSDFSAWAHPAVEPGALFQADQIAKQIYEILHKDTVGGLIVISGATGCAKSTITRCLINEYLTAAAADKKRRPHLITYEDPIESSFCHQPAVLRSDRSFDYTPRQKGGDVESVGTVLIEALRQKPAVVYVGETRESSEWRDVLKFAATGHLIITTTHAGSLSECMGKILEESKAHSAADRSNIGSRILAAVHLRAVQCGDAKTVVPTLWTRTRPAIMNFVARGLASLLPGSSAEGGSAGCVGRRGFCALLAKGPGLEQREELPALEAACMKLDLLGE